MVRVIMADDSIAFDGVARWNNRSWVARGHVVSVRNRCAAPLHYQGVEWQPLTMAWL
ncbi:MAG: hypothetical protein FD153_848 [Rhodospirillaceae bacterium]|nr:MAG: hypothetical protein FD153_848 [Rhodospirillaceae bacterium]